jgi:hypothetical protein
MVKKDGTVLGLFVDLPGVEKITHDHDDIPPAQHILVALLLGQFQDGTLHLGYLSLIPQMVASQPGGMIELFLQL